MLYAQTNHPHDAGLPENAIRCRRRSRRLARIMLFIAILTAALGWPLFGDSIRSAIRIKDQPPSLVIIAYALLIVSSVTLVLGLWYMLLAQVERVAHIVDTAEHEDPMTSHTSTEPAPAQAARCRICSGSVDTTDRFCRHCGKPLHALAAPLPLTKSA